MVKAITSFACEVCGTEYGYRHLAEICEASPPLSPCPVKPGDKVKVYERYDAPQDDEVVSVAIGEQSAWTLASWKDQEVPDFVKNRQYHVWYITVQKDHQMSKDDDSWTNVVTINDIMVDGKWLGDQRHD